MLAILAGDVERLKHLRCTSALPSGGECGLPDVQRAAEESAAQQMMELRMSLEARLAQSEAALASACEQLAQSRQRLRIAEAQSAAANVELEQSRSVSFPVHSFNQACIIPCPFSDIDVLALGQT
jgi:hypothetical protein